MIQIENGPSAYAGCYKEAIYRVSGCTADEITEV